MIGPASLLALPAPPSRAIQPAPFASDDARLRKTSSQMAGLFVERMFAAMRDTVPTDGTFAPSSAESTFTDMLDEKMSEQVPSQWTSSHSLAQALYTQLRARLAESGGSASAAGETTAPVSSMISHGVNAIIDPTGSGTP
jgi:Rod binding domain-containing protein